MDRRGFVQPPLRSSDLPSRRLGFGQWTAQRSPYRPWLQATRRLTEMFSHSSHLLPCAAFLRHLQNSGHHACVIKQLKQPLETTQSHRTVGMMNSNTLRTMSNKQLLRPPQYPSWHLPLPSYPPPIFPTSTTHQHLLSLRQSSNLRP